MEHRLADCSSSRRSLTRGAGPLPGLCVQLTLQVLQMQVDGVLAHVVAQQLHHEGDSLGDDGGLVSALPARLGQALTGHAVTVATARLAPFTQDFLQNNYSLL